MAVHNLVWYSGKITRVRETLVEKSAEVDCRRASWRLPRLFSPPLLCSPPPPPLPLADSDYLGTKVENSLGSLARKPFIVLL